jgi:hypothetical protein
MARDIPDTADIGDGRAAEFHHDARHGGRSSLRSFGRKRPEKSRFP